jgi:flagellar protein FliS
MSEPRVMTAMTYGRNLAAYNSVATHSGIADGDPHRLILMLLDGALERVAMARGCLQRGEIGQKAALLQRVMAIVGELRESLDLQRGGTLASNLHDLYDYVERQLLRANTENRGASLDEVTALLNEIRSAWAAVPLAVRGGPAA